MTVRVSSDKVQGHMHPIAGARDCTFEDGVNIEGAGDFRQRPVRVLELHGGGAGNDPEGGILGEHGRQFVGHAVGEVLLIRIAGEIVEGENGDRGDRSVRVSIEEAGSQRVRAEGEYRNGNEHADTEGSDHPESVLGFGSRWDDGRSRDLRWSWRQVDQVPGRLSWLGDFWLNGRNECDEAVTRAGDRLHKPRLVRTVTKDLANFTDCCVDSEFDIDEDFPLPKAPCNFIPGNNLSVFGDQG